MIEKPGDILRLARLYNVQTSYYDVFHNRQRASLESLFAVLQALGAPIASVNDVQSALREKRQNLQQQSIEPVNVVFSGSQPYIKVNLPSGLTGHPLEVCLELESGERREYKWSSNHRAFNSMEVEGTTYITSQMNLPQMLPPGYHRLSLRTGKKQAETLVISAPEKAYAGSNNRDWGFFTPLYALHATNSWGSGDYSTLGSLVSRSSSLGASVIATLPLLPTFLNEPYDPSPYAPISRLLWNEFYIDVTSIPELIGSTKAKAILQSYSLDPAIKELRKSTLVNYRHIMMLKRQIIAECCQYLMKEGQSSHRFQDFNKFTQTNPVVNEYAGFRSVMEKQGSPWLSWPARLQNGLLNENDYALKEKLYYMYAQWIAHQQIKKIADSAGRRNVKLYFDLPLGTHPQGYDTWKYRDSFAAGITVGAPPDAVFKEGQKWGFPPLHPERIREQNYRYFIDYLRHNMEQADMMRIDHVMGLHRLFWIPGAKEARYGAFVHNHSQELYAILSLESHRHHCVIVGEDLGTVPAYVRPSMARHGFQHMYVLHYELASRNSGLLPVPQHNTVASLNTHDMPTFASFWEGTDISERIELGLLNNEEDRRERQLRRKIEQALVIFLKNRGWLRSKVNDEQAILKACLSFLSSSRARAVILNLEDLWLETLSQNVPGTDEKSPNWQRKARYTLEEIFKFPEVHGLIKTINEIRRQS